MEMVVELMEMDPGALLHLGRVPEQRLLSPESPLRWRWCCGTFHEILILFLGFSSSGEYIGKGARLMEAWGAHTTPWHGPP